MITSKLPLMIACRLAACVFMTSRAIPTYSFLRAVCLCKTLLASSYSPPLTSAIEIMANNWDVPDIIVVEGGSLIKEIMGRITKEKERHQLPMAISHAKSAEPSETAEAMN